MSQEIMEGIRTIEREKGIETDRLSRRSRTRSSLRPRRHRVLPATPR